MQRIPNNTYMPRQNAQNTETSASSALQLARRIRNEQGAERARQYLIAMEPFLAPAERYHIADQLGIPVPRPSDNYNASVQQQSGGMGGLGGLGGNPMQLLSMLGAMNNKGTQSAGGMDPMAMAQLLGGIMGKK